MIDRDDLQVEIPAKALAALAEILDQVARCNTVDIQGIPALVATREAAARLNLPTLACGSSSMTALSPRA